jgi:hypothetical protein
VTSKQARVQAAMRDPSLTPQQRQQRIREIMTGPAEAPLPSEGRGGESGSAVAEGGVTLTKQERVRAVMQDTSINPAQRQQRIQAIMREPAPESASSSAADKAKEEEERKGQLKLAQARVKALVAHGKAQIGEKNKVNLAAPVPDLAGDRPVDVRIILGVEGGQVGEEDVLSLGVMAANSTIREVKATATFGVEQLSLTAVHLFTPERTRLVVAVSGQVLHDEDRPISTVATDMPELSLLLVPREFEDTVLGSIHAHKEAVSPPARRGGEGGGGVEEEDASEDEGGGEGGMGLDDAACSMFTEDNSDGTYWLNFSFVSRGVFDATVLYKGVALQGATFQVVVLKPETYNSLKQRTSAKPPQPRAGRSGDKAPEIEREQVSFSAMLLSEEGYGAQEWQAVDVRFTHRQMMLYKSGGAIEALTGFKNFNARLYSCPIRKTVKFAPVVGRPQVGIMDGSGRELILSTPLRVLIQASFYLLLNDRMSGSGQQILKSPLDSDCI